MIPKRDAGEEDGGSEELSKQIEKIMDQQREIEIQRADEVRASMNLEKLRIESKSKAEIDEKQKELESIQKQLKQNSGALQML